MVIVYKYMVYDSTLRSSHFADIWIMLVTNYYDIIINNIYNYSLEFAKTFLTPKVSDCFQETKFRGRRDVSGSASAPKDGSTFRQQTDKDLPKC